MRNIFAVISVLFGLLFVSKAVEAGPLHDATKVGDLAKVRRLLEQGAKIEEGDGEGKTALYLAAELNHLEIVTLLLGWGADPNRLAIGIQGPTNGPIHVATKKGNLEVIRALAESGADLSLATIYSQAPLHLAVKHNQVEAAKLLRSLGAANFKAPSVNHLITTSDIVLGKKLVKGCNRCHALSKDGEPGGGYGSVVGPTLWNVVGRPKASVPGWKYSDAMHKLDGRWTYSDLNDYIANPTASVPGTIKWYLVKQAEQRAAIIAYLRTLADQPAPLP